MLATLVALPAMGWSDSPIADAAMRGDLDQLRTLVAERPADVNVPQGDGMTALHWAAERGDATMAALLLEAGASVAATTRIGDYTPLHLASKGGSPRIVRMLLEGGADVHALTSNSGATALHFAAGAGTGAAVELLIEAGAALNARESEWGQTPLMFAAANDRPAAIRALLGGGADPDLTSRAIDVPARVLVDVEAERRLEEVLSSFREDGTEPTPTEIQRAIEAMREVQAASDDAVATVVTDEYGRQSNPAEGYPSLVGSWGGLTALLHAARQGHIAAAEALLDGGADIDRPSGGDHTTPLLMAAINGQFDLALVLIERGADPNVASHHGTTPLFATINVQWAPRSRYPQPQEHGQQEATYLEVMEALLRSGADPDARLSTHLWYLEYTFALLGIDLVGATPFWRAAYATDLEALRLLATWGANPELPTTMAAVQRGQSGAVTRVQRDAKPDPSGLLPVPPGGPAVFPIHAAAGVGYGTHRAGNHHRHVPDGWLSSVRFLVEEMSADVNARDFNGYTPLHHAAARGDNELIRYLVAHGADVTVISRKGQTTADMANGPIQRVRPFPETIALLESLGSKNNHNCIGC